MGTTFAAGTLTYSAYPPLMVEPSMPALRQELFFARQAKSALAACDTRVDYNAVAGAYPGNLSAGLDYVARDIAAKHVWPLNRSLVPRAPARV